jgi:hypothetical protein
VVNGNFKFAPIIQFGLESEGATIQWPLTGCHCTTCKEAICTNITGGSDSSEPMLQAEYYVSNVTTQMVKASNCEGSELTRA